VHVHAAVDDNRLAGHEVAVVGGEKKAQCRQNPADTNRAVLGACGPEAE